MNREDIIFAVLHSFNLSISKVNNLIKTFGTPSLVLDALDKKDMRLNSLLTVLEQNSMSCKINKDYIKKIENRLNEINVFVITTFSDYIPNRISIVFERCKTLGLFFKGDLKCLETTTCAIVGSRMPNAYGKRVASDFASKIAKAKATIISGLASGIDSIAHTEALNNNAKTVAVLGGGFNKIYPEFNTNLANKIIEQGGLLVSEYPPQMQTQSYFFPVRNRIIAALSDAVVIAQFKTKSGAMHTKNYAVEYGVDLFVPVADIYSEHSSGNLATIEELPFTAVVKPEQVLYALKLEVKADTSYDNLTSDEIAIVKLLSEKEKHFDDLVAESGFTPQRVNVLLTTLKISGIIKELAGNFFSL